MTRRAVGWGRSQALPVPLLLSLLLVCPRPQSLHPKVVGLAPLCLLHHHFPSLAVVVALLPLVVSATGTGAEVGMTMVGKRGAMPW